MRLMQSILMRAFGRPQGALGRLGGVIMARTNGDCGAWVAGLLEVTAEDRVLEVGFGPGVVIERLAKLASCRACRGHRSVPGDGRAGSRSQHGRGPEWSRRAPPRFCEK